ncbi:MAG: ABC transporter permease [Dongiaceae bacterium]
MAPLESVRIAFGALRAHPMRSLLTMLGIIIGVAAVIAMVAVGAGARVRVAEQIRTLGTNLLMVEPGAAQEGGARLAGGTRHTLTEDDAAAIGGHVPGVLAAAPSVRGTGQVVHGNRNWNTVVNGTRPDYFIAREWPLDEGRAFSAEETRTAAKVVVLGARVANSLFAEESPLGQIVRVANVPFQVIGVLAAKGPDGSGRDQDDVVFVPIATAKLRLFGGAHQVDRGSLNYVLVKVGDVAAMDSVRAEIRGLLRDRHRLPAGAPDDFQIWDPAASVAAQHEATRTLSFLLAAIASVSLVVGGISIMNIMLVSVTERTREIGLRLAVGARRRDIRRQFLAEAVALCLVGGALGIAAGVAGAALLSRLAGWAVFIGPEAVAAAALFAAAIGIFFGYYPAAKAARLDPIEALRFE